VAPAASDRLLAVLALPAAVAAASRSSKRLPLARLILLETAIHRSSSWSAAGALRVALLRASRAGTRATASRTTATRASM
jgi:hypothetical protein